MDLPTEDYLAIEPGLRSLAASRNITNFGDARLAVAAFGLVGKDNQVVSSSGVLKVATVTLTDAQIKGHVPVVIVPATQVINNVGIPNTIPVPVTAIAVLDTTAGEYTGVDDFIQIELKWSSDAALTIGTNGEWSNPASSGSAVTPVTLSDIFSNPLRSIVGFLMAPTKILPDDLLDNAISVYIPGTRTGGNSLNTMKVTIYYTVVEVN